MRKFCFVRLCVSGWVFYFLCMCIVECVLVLCVCGVVDVCVLVWSVWWRGFGVGSG